MLSEFNYNYKSDEFYNSDERTKASSESNTFDKENSVNKASEYHDFIKEHQAGTTKEKETNLKSLPLRNEFRKLEAISWVELNLLFCVFFENVRKKMAMNTNLEL